MYSKNIKFKELPKKNLDISIEDDSCEVSKASVEIMLDRFCNGNEIDFPFLNN
tara:strand:- start:436 stop:594 length:159 start_codon:yes stop_codon:yes gene_type:complete